MHEHTNHKHAHGEKHSHSQGHSHGAENLKNGIGRAFAWGVGLNMAFIISEVVFGFIANSSALIADATHNFSDVLGLLLAWGAIILAKRIPTTNYTYGLRSATILSVLASTALLFAAVGAIIWSAINRFGEPVEVQSTLVMAVAAFGIFINGLSAYLLSKNQNDINIKAAFLHLVGDALVSAGVVVAGIIIYFSGWYIIDPIVSLLISAFILWSGWGVLKDAVKLSLNSVPNKIKIDEVKKYLLGLDGVKSLHDLHIWPISTTETALTAHLIVNITGDDKFLHDISHNLHEIFDIDHATIQIEKGEGAECKLEPDDVV